jgi:hypothetical protein
MNKFKMQSEGVKSVGTTCVKCSYSLAHKSMVKTTKRSTWLLVESIDRMHETSLVVEERIKDSRIYYWQITRLLQKQNWQR